jgi:hypothetical protein
MLRKKRLGFGWLARGNRKGFGKRALSAASLMMDSCAKYAHRSLRANSE